MVFTRQRPATGLIAFSLCAGAAINQHNLL